MKKNYNTQIIQPIWTKIGSSFQSQTYTYHYDLVIPSLGIYPREISPYFYQNFNKNVDISFIYRSQNMEITQKPINKGKDKYILVYTCNEISSVVRRINCWINASQKHTEYNIPLLVHL